MIRFRAATLALALTAGVPAALSAQAKPAAELPGRIVSVNPFLPLFGYFQGEFESRINKSLTFAVSGSYVEWLDDDPSLNLDAKVRWYGQERAPSGLGMAVSLGVGRIQQDARLQCDYAPVVPNCNTIPKGSVMAPAFAVEGQYQWLLGSRKNTAVSVGFGAKRYFAGKDELQTEVRPTLRLTIGYAF